MLSVLPLHVCGSQTYIYNFKRYANFRGWWVLIISLLLAVYIHQREYHQVPMSSPSPHPTREGPGFILTIGLFLMGCYVCWDEG